MFHLYLRKNNELCSENWNHAQLELHSGNCFVEHCRAPQSFVERTLAIALQIQGDISEAGGFEALGDGCGHFLRQRARHFILRDFDSGKIVVDAHAKLAEAEFAEYSFAAFDQS